MRRPKARLEWLLLVRTLFVWAALHAGVAHAWVYPEHRDLALAAVQALDADRRGELDRYWALAREGQGEQLCVQAAVDDQGLAPNCIDWAAWSAIAGDHSCSSAEMLDTARSAAWILQVADVASQLKADLTRVKLDEVSQDSDSGKRNIIADAKRRLASERTVAERNNALRTADIRLQRADTRYATRAGSNNAHFLLPRPTTGTTLAEYAELSLQAGAELSAVGVYASFHLSALQKAKRLAHESLPPAERAALVRAMLADEAFALHFLQDVFASGHIAGTWGTAAQRQGTHDYYNRNGLEVFTWKGGSSTVVLMGDANMRSEDVQVASAAVRISLSQMLDAAAGRAGDTWPDTSAAPQLPDGFDICTNSVLPVRPPGLRTAPSYIPYFEAAVGPSPVPSLGPGLGAMPRFRNEVGPFIGLAGTIDGRMINGGFMPTQNDWGTVGGLDLSVRAGLGLDGVMSESGDGLVYGSIGLRADSPSSNRFNDTSLGSFGGNLTSAVPARTGLSLRLRMPFYVVPGDLLLLSPMYLVDPDLYTSMAITAGNGGLVPWQAGWSTALGRFQFVLGRELGVTFWGRTGGDQFLAPAIAPGLPPRIVRFKSTSFDLPILEFRPFRAFSNNQSSSVLFQLFASADVPSGAQVDFPAGAPAPDLHTVWSIGLRMVFDWRYYY